MRKEFPELPWEKRDRYEKDYGIKAGDVEIYIKPGLISSFFEKVCADFAGDKNLIKLASNYITSDLLGLMKNADVESLGLVSDKNFSDLIKMVAESKISSRGAKDILKMMFEKGGQPMEIAETENLLQKSDLGELQAIAEKIIIDSPKIVADYKAGKEVALQSLVGQGMKATKGSANPQVLKEVFLSLLNK